MSKLTTHCLWSNLLFQTRFLLNLGKGCLPEGKMLSAMESMLTCLVTNVRTLLPSVLSKTSTSHTKHNFLKWRKEEEQKCKYHIIHSPQGFSGIIYNTGWGTLPDCLRCSLQDSNEGMSNDAPIHECES